MHNRGRAWLVLVCALCYALLLSVLCTLAHVTDESSGMRQKDDYATLGDRCGCRAGAGRIGRRGSGRRGGGRPGAGSGGRAGAATWGVGCRRAFGGPDLYMGLRL